MARVITLSRQFLKGHPKAGQPTYFVERALASMASLRVWTGKPYRSPQIAIAPDVKLRVVNIVVDYKIGFIYKEFNGSGFKTLDPNILALNDGLTFEDFVDWFEFKKHKGKNIAKEAQILIWGDVKEY